MILFKILFYGFGLLLAFIELLQFKYATKIIQKMSDYYSWMNIRKKDKMNTDWDDTPDDLKKYVLFRVLFSLTELSWLVLGIFTFNWGFFTTYLIVMIFLGRLFKSNKPSPIFFSFKAIMFILFAFFVAINSFHLQIDFFSLWK